MTKNECETNMLEKIKNPNDIKKVKSNEYSILAEEIRSFLLKHVSERGGHLAANLGAVELTMALHIVLDFPKDKLVWDVGHQAYTHKILTGRKDDFGTLRTYKGLSGFPKRHESPCDAFDTGHSSTSISAALGLAAARDLKGGNETIVAVIGDGSLSGGMAYEALNNMLSIKKNFIVILNDNEMSITQNVGGMSAYLSKIRLGTHYNEFKEWVEKLVLKVPKVGKSLAKLLQKSKESLKQLVIPGMIFEDMGITYVGPIDGHNVSEMVETISEAKKLDEPVLIHVVTCKGKGYELAEKQPAKFHGIEPFDMKTGKVLRPKTQPTYTDVFGQKLRDLGKEDRRIVAVTAAMKTGTGLEGFGDAYSNRLFDVGIAEQHAVTFAAGMAVAGMKPVVAVYSSFLQRAYDQILHDICIQNLPVVFALDRSGLVGADGETHQGVFDLSYLSTMPNMTIMAPINGRELEMMLEFALQQDTPMAIRYPRGAALRIFEEIAEPLECGKSQVLNHGKEIALVVVGNMMEEAIYVQSELAKKGMDATLVNARFVKPLDTKMLDDLCANHSMIVTMEENVAIGGYGQMVAQYLMEQQYQGVLLTIALPDEFIEQGSVAQLRKQTGIDGESILTAILGCRKG